MEELAAVTEDVAATVAPCPGGGGGGGWSGFKLWSPTGEKEEWEGRGGGGGGGGQVMSISPWTAAGCGLGSWRESREPGLGIKRADACAMLRLAMFQDIASVSLIDSTTENKVNRWRSFKPVSAALGKD